MVKRFTWIWMTVVLSVFTVNLHAQDWKSIITGIASAVGDKVTGNNSLEGTWKYAGPDCKFSSDNFLATAGGELAAKKVEEQMGGILEKIGFKDGATYVFNADSTYTSTIQGRSMSGTYSYNADTKELVLKTRLGIKLNMTVSKGLAANKMSLLFKANKLMSLLQTIGGVVSKQSSNSAVSTANALLKEYDGLMLGFELEKQ